MTRQQQLVLRAQSLLAGYFGPWGSGSIYRNPAESGGRVGAAVVVTASVSAWRRPATKDARQMKSFPVVLNNSTRVTHILKVAAGTDIRYGDQWREGATTFMVVGVAAFHTCTLCALDEVKS